MLHRVRWRATGGRAGLATPVRLPVGRGLCLRVGLPVSVAGSVLLLPLLLLVRRAVCASDDAAARERGRAVVLVVHLGVNVLHARLATRVHRILLLHLLLS